MGYRAFDRDNKPASLSKIIQPRTKSQIQVNKAVTPSQTNQGFFHKVLTKQTEIPQTPYVTSKNWICLNADTLEVVYGSRVYEEREVASVTKIMTCLVTLEFVEQFDIDIDKTHYLVSKKAALLGGTTASLKRDDYVSVRDLLYGLMLPSGNDAAQTLAENVVTHRYILDKHKNCNPNEISYDEEVPADKNLEEEFYKLMNTKARQLNLQNTNYDSSHGLSNKVNYSCCYDQAVLGAEAMKHTILQNIVKTTTYSALIERNDRDFELVWKNTNKLLDRKGYKGIKTGITNAAGGCLATYYHNKGTNFLTVVLGARDQHSRFLDTEAINNWVSSNCKDIMQLPLEDRYSE